MIKAQFVSYHDKEDEKRHVGPGPITAQHVAALFCNGIFFTTAIFWGKKTPTVIFFHALYIETHFAMF